MNSRGKADTRASSAGKLISGALLVSFTNRGVAASLLIYLAFLSPEHAFLPQAVAMGVCAVLISFSVYASYILMASRAGVFFSSRAMLGKVVGCVYLTVVGALLLI